MLSVIFFFVTSAIIQPVSNQIYILERFDKFNRNFIIFDGKKRRGANTGNENSLFSVLCSREASKTPHFVRRINNNQQINLFTTACHETTILQTHKYIYIARAEFCFVSSPLRCYGGANLV